MRLLLDTNILLDVLMSRQPHAAMSDAVWSAVETRQTQGLLSAHAITTIHYLYSRHADKARADRTVAGLLKVFSIATVNQAVIEEASAMRLPDFEDAVTACAAQHAGCDLIVTRDPRGFRGSTIPPVSPEAALALLGKGV
jgi:predicted nucleic acid-binding protein